MTRLAWIAAFAAFVLAGAPAVALADEETEDPGDPDVGSDEPDEPEMLDADVLPGYPMEEVARPLVLTKGMIEAELDVGLPGGPDDTGDYGAFHWFGMTLRGHYGVKEKIEAGVSMPLVFVKPDFGLADGPKTFGGIAIDGAYDLGDKGGVWIAPHAEVSLGPANAEGQNHFGVPYYAGGLKPGFALGALLKYPIGDKMAVGAQPHLILQIEGAVDDMGGKETLIAFTLPVGFTYQVLPELAASLRTGFVTGQTFKAGGDDGAALPLIAEAQYTLMNGELDAGLDVGLGNLTPPDMVGVGDTLFIGVFAAWRVE